MLWHYNKNVFPFLYMFVYYFRYYNSCFAKTSFYLLYWSSFIINHVFNLFVLDFFLFIVDIILIYYFILEIIIHVKIIVKCLIKVLTKRIKYKLIITAIRIETRLIFVNIILFEFVFLIFKIIKLLVFSYIIRQFYWSILYGMIS